MIDMDIPSLPSLPPLYVPVDVVYVDFEDGTLNAWVDAGYILLVGVVVLRSYIYEFRAQKRTLM